MLKQIAKQFKNKRVLILGDIMLDEYWHGESITIAEHNQAIKVKRKEYILGAAANVANNIKSLGGIPYLVSIIGDDIPGNIIINLLKNNNIENYLIKDKNRITTVKTRSVDKGKVLFRNDYETTEEIKDIKPIINKIKDLKFDSILLSDYDKGTITQELYDYIKTLNIPIALDPKIKRYFKDVDYLKPNIKELQDLTNIKIKNKEDILKASKKLKEEFNIKTILTTAGEDGIYIYNNNLEHIELRKKRTVFDFTGAGDTGAAVLALAITTNADIKQIAHLINHAAGISVEKPGVTTISIQELLKDLETF